MKVIRNILGLGFRQVSVLSVLLAAVLALSSMSGAPDSTPSNYEDRIRAQFRSSHWSEGGAILDSALHDYPQVAAFYELKGQHILHDIETGEGTAREKGRAKSYELARFYLIKSIEMDEKNLNSRRLLLRIEIETQHYSSAIVYCNELLEENPYNEHLWRTKIDLYRKLGNDLEADRLLERLLTIYHNDSTLRKDVVERKQDLANKQHKKGDIRGQEESLRQLIELEPANAEHYKALFSLLYRSGRMDEAAEIAERGAMAVSSLAERDSLIGKRVSVLMEMNRYLEAQNYLASKRLEMQQSPYLQHMRTNLDTELARQARMNDPYVAYAKVYDKQHSQEALNYLIGTSMQRGYHDDALYYIREGRKRSDTPQLRYKEYQTLRRDGHTKRAVETLRSTYEMDRKDTAVAIELAETYLAQTAPLIVHGQYDEAIPQLRYVYNMKADEELTQAACNHLFNCYMQNRQYDQAEALLDEAGDDGSGKYAVRKAMLLNLKGQGKDALRMLAREYRSLPDSMAQQRGNISYSYEEIAVPYIKSLIASGMTNAAWDQVRDALEICPRSNDILHYAISLSMARHDEQQAKRYAERGMATFPGDPYFRLKHAQLLIQEADYSTSIDSLRALLDIYPGDSTIVLAHSDCSESLALKYMKNRQNERALEVLDSALYFDPGSHTLLYTKALVYQKMKNWKEAERCLKGYKPDFREWAAYRRNLQELAHQQMLNSLSLEYQRARLGSVDAITGNAYLSYTRKLPWLNRKGEHRMDAITFGVAYAGRDGSADDASEQTKGGTGIQLTAAWEHQFSNRLTGKGEVGWSNKYFPTFIANLSATYDMKCNWQLMGRANFRWLKTYTGIWGMTHEFAGYDQDGNLMYADVMKLKDWKVKNKPMIQVGIGAAKTLGVEERFNLSAGADGFLLSGNLYYNVNAKLQFFPLQDKKTFVFGQAGLGTAPESSLIDQSLAAGFADLNTFVSMGGQYFVNKYITLGLSGSWYTMLTQKETLSLPIHGTTAQTSKNYSNYFYLHTSLLISF